MCYLYTIIIQQHKRTEIMTTQEIKAEYSRMAGIYNRNLSYLRRQASRQEFNSLMQKWDATCDTHLAKKLMLNGIQLGN